VEKLHAWHASNASYYRCKRAYYGHKAREKYRALAVLVEEFMSSLNMLFLKELTEERVTVHMLNVYADVVPSNTAEECSEEDKRYKQVQIKVRSGSKQPCGKEQAISWQREEYPRLEKDNEEHPYVSVL
jgi:hypothetical protein